MKKSWIMLCIPVLISPAAGVWAQQGIQHRAEWVPVRNMAASTLQPAAPDSVVTLTMMLEEALRGNPRLQAARSRADIAEQRIRQAGAWDDPQVGVEFYATPITSANPIRDGAETDYFVQQMIPLFGKKGLMADAAEAASHGADELAMTVERSLRADVKRAYAMIYAAQMRIEVNRENQTLLEQLTTAVRTRYSVGQASFGDVVKLQLELGKLQNERDGLEQELSGAVGMINALRGLPATTPLGPVAAVVPVQVPDSLEALSARAVETRPELRGMQFELQMNTADLSASRREWIPDLMVRGMYKQMKMGTDQWDAMLSINLPFLPWSSGKYSGKVEENELAVRATRQSIADMRNMILAEVRDAWTKSSSRWRQLQRYSRVMLPQAEQALQALLNSYRTGGADFLSLLDSYRMLQMLRMDYYMALGEYESSVASLEQALGNDLH